MPDCNVTERTPDRLAVLLRGINLGKHNKVPMAGLRAALTEARFTGVRTHVASGNVVVDRGDLSPDEVAERVRALVAERFAVDVPCLARTPQELTATVRADPLGALPGVADDPARHGVVFLASAPELTLVATVDPAAYTPERFAVVGRDIHTWFPDGTQNARLNHNFWERRLGITGTARNWRTVTALERMLTEV